MTDNSWEEILKSIKREAGSYGAPDKDAAEKSVHEEKAKQLQNEHEEQKLKLQEKMFYWIRAVVSVWFGFIAYFLSLYLFLRILYGDDLIEKDVLITLLATTTVNIIGLPLVVTKSLFK